MPLRLVIAALMAPSSAPWINAQVGKLGADKWFAKSGEKADIKDKDKAKTIAKKDTKKTK
jgi:hypothetical protein